MTDCQVACSCHVSPFTHVPVCPTHHIPLHAAEAGNGLCPWVGAERLVHHVGGREMVPDRCIAWGPGAWLWMRRDTFDWHDLPPHNGCQPPRYPSPGGPVWEVEWHHCEGCGVNMPHVVGDNRSVCTSCGAAAWVPDPQYVNAGDAS